MRDHCVRPRVTSPELLLVTLVLMIVVFLLVPVSRALSADDPRADCLLRLRKIATAVQLFNQDHGGRFSGVLCAGDA